MHAIEKELISITGYSSRKKYVDRQDYLGSILNSAMKLSDDQFDELTDEAAAWVNAAITAHNSKEDFPDFDEKVPTDFDDEEDDSEAENADDQAEDADEGDEDEADDEAEMEASEDDEPADDEPEEKPKRHRKPRPVKKPVNKETGPKPAPSKRGKELDEDPDVILDKWGCMEGSKNSQALALFEKGATAREVKDAIGGTYYNVLKKMMTDGHTLEKEGALIKLIHKDADKVAKPPKKAKK